MTVESNQPENSGVLAGLIVVDLGRFIAGPACATMLANYGATVIRVDSKEGNTDRYLRTITDFGDGSMFLQLANNKKSLSVDLRSDKGKEILDKLIVMADVIVANLTDPGLKHLGLDFDRIHKMNEKCILVTNTAFGTEGPLGNNFGFDGVAQAMSGAMHMSGPEGGPPSRNIVPYADFFSAMQATIAVLVALKHRDTTGKGQRIKTCLLHSALYMASSNFIEPAATGKVRPPSGNLSPFSAPSDCIKAKDGWLLVQCIGTRQFINFAKAIDKEQQWSQYFDLTDIERGEQYGAQLSAEVEAWAQNFTRSEAVAHLAKFNIPSGAVLTPSEVLEDSHIAESHFLNAVEMPGASELLPIVQHPATMSDEACIAPYRRPSTLGEDNREVLNMLGYSEQDIDAMEQQQLLGAH